MLAGDSLWRHYRRDHSIKGRWENMSSSSSSSVAVLFEACVLLLLWRALARRLRDVCIRVLVIWHLMTHTIFASFVCARSMHAMSSRGQSACTGLSREAAVCFPRFKTHCCRGTEGNELVGLAGGSGWWVSEGAFLLALVGFLAIAPQLEWASHFFMISMRRLRGNGKIHFPLASIGFSIPVMLTLRGCVKTAMRGCPLWKRR